jgi:hypothetical protein
MFGFQNRQSRPWIDSWEKRVLKNDVAEDAQLFRESSHNLDFKSQMKQATIQRFVGSCATVG